MLRLPPVLSRKHRLGGFLTTAPCLRLPPIVFASFLLQGVCAEAASFNLQAPVLSGAVAEVGIGLRTLCARRQLLAALDLSLQRFVHLQLQCLR